MPCWSRLESNPDLANIRGERLEVLRAALIAMGYNIYAQGYAGFEDCELVADGFKSGIAGTSVRVKNGKVIVSGRQGVNIEEATRAVKRGYSAAVVDSAMKRFGWNATKVGEKVIARRRY